MDHGLVNRVGGFVGKNARRQAAHQLRHLLGGGKEWGGREERGALREKDNEGKHRKKKHEFSVDSKVRNEAILK